MPSARRESTAIAQLGDYSAGGPHRDLSGCGEPCGALQADRLAEKAQDLPRGHQSR